MAAFSVSVGMLVKRNCYFSKLALFQRSSRNFCLTSVVKKQQASSEVVIPAYIPRGPTDILQALASTVKLDPTASRYVYHDDPYLIPSSGLNKRTFILSKESGRKAARYFLENFPKDFENDEAEPKIPAFNPPLKLTEKSEVTAETLTDFIHSFQVNSSLQAYANLNKAGENIRNETLCELLELLCYYNGSEPDDETYRDEAWFRLHQGGREPTTIWKEGGIAEEIFNDMEVKDGRAYRALIQGTSRYGNPTKALQLYSEMKEKGLKGTTTMYNCLMGLIPSITRDPGARWEKAEEFMQAMIQEEVKPDLLTFNTLLYLISRMPGWNNNTNKCKSVLAEMKAVGIKPSLGTFNHVLHIFCRPRGNSSNILYEVMDIVESQSWELQDPYDMSFFPTAMAVANNHLHDVEMAHRVYNALNSGNNRRFIEDSHKETIFFSSYFTVMCSALEPEKLIEFYERLVPSEYVPEPPVMEKIVDVIGSGDCLRYIPKLWSDILIFQMENRDNIVKSILSIVAKGGRQSDEILKQQLLTAAWSTFHCFKESSRYTKARVKLSWTGDMLGDLLTCCLNGDNLEKAWEVVNYLVKNSYSVPGYAPAEPLLEFCKTALETGSFQRALTCLKYALDADIPQAGTFLQKNSNLIPKDFLNRYSVLVKDEE